MQAVCLNHNIQNGWVWTNPSQLGTQKKKKKKSREIIFWHNSTYSLLEQQDAE